MKMNVNLRNHFPGTKWGITDFGHSKCNFHKKTFVIQDLITVMTDIVMVCSNSAFCTQRELITRGTSLPRPPCAMITNRDTWPYGR